MAKKAILCVDDERIILTSLRDQITHHFGGRYLCELAESADEALEVIEELTQDGVSILIIVSDWLMPHMKGDEFLIRVHQQFPGIVKVLLTGHADEDAIERTRKYANLHSYIPKPWDEETLIEILETGLEDVNE
jgi:DNA-binding NtrC family response regulator